MNNPSPGRARKLRRLGAWGTITLSAIVVCAFLLLPSELHKAANAGDIETVKSLIAAKADVNDITWERFGWETPLFVAAREGHTEIVRRLLEAGADPNIRCAENGTALTIAAARYGRTEILRLLIDAGADVLGPRPKGRAALGWSAMKGDYLSFRLILDESRRAGFALDEEASILDDLAYRNDDLRHTLKRILSWRESDAPPLHKAVRAGAIEEVRALLKSGTDPSLPDEHGWTATHWAAGYEGSFEVLRLLLESGADPNSASQGGFTPLMAAVRSSDIRRISLLLEAGADPNAIDEDHRTALHTAAWRAQPDVIDALFDRKADPTIRNRWSQIPRALAEARKDNRGDDVLALFDERTQAWWPTNASEIELITTRGHKPTLGLAESAMSEENGRTTLEAVVWIWDNAPIDLAFDVFWSVEGHSTHLGQLVANQGMVRAFSFVGVSDQPTSGGIELVLKPSRKAAFEQLRTWEIWGEDVVLRSESKDN